MKEIILVGADWCGSCKAMKEWFFSMEMPGVILSYLDVEEIAAPITSIPVIAFKENDELIQEIVGAVSKADLIRKAKSIFEE
jgi:thiol-disulfide isomerase/thioredoxin